MKPGKTITTVGMVNTWAEVTRLEEQLTTTVVGVDIVVIVILLSLVVHTTMVVVVTTEAELRSLVEILITTEDNTILRDRLELVPARPHKPFHAGSNPVPATGISLRTYGTRPSLGYSEGLAVYPFMARCCVG